MQREQHDPEEVRTVTIAIVGTAPLIVHKLWLDGGCVRYGKTQEDRS